jgi:hypothetical protein
MQRYKGELVGGGRTAECIVIASPTGGWLIYEEHLPEGVYALTFGDWHPKNPDGILKRGQARRGRDGRWTVEDVRDA